MHLAALDIGIEFDAGDEFNAVGLSGLQCLNEAIGTIVVGQRLYL